MSSFTYTSTSKKGLFSTFPAKFHSHSIDEPDGKPMPDEKPKDQMAVWKPGGYKPSRASWNTFRGRIKSTLA